MDAELVKGTLSLLILSLLSRRPMYGYEIAKKLEQLNGGSLPMNAGALYPVLRSLEKQQLLSSYTELSDGGRARRYYEVTETGSETIGQWRDAWQDTKQFVDTIVDNRNDELNRTRDRSVSKTSRKGTQRRAARNQMRGASGLSRSASGRSRAIRTRPVSLRLGRASHPRRPRGSSQRLARQPD